MFLDPGITVDMAQSKDYDHLLWLWKGWRDQTGPKIKPLFNDYVSLSNRGATAAGFKVYFKILTEESGV